MNMFDSTTIPVLQEVLTFTEARHTVLAGNIANMDTPGYKARDLDADDFQVRLKSAIEARNAPPSPISEVEIAKGEVPFGTKPLMGEVAKNTHTILRHDQSDVATENQVTEMLKNQLQHNTALAVMVKQLQLLDVAISGKV